MNSFFNIGKFFCIFFPFVNARNNIRIPYKIIEFIIEHKKSKILDLCTGSGAIAVAVKKETSTEVFASDISDDALSLATENAKNNNADITFIKSDLFSDIKEKFDVIISNPPYIKTGDISFLQKEVKDYEPILALDGGEDGLSFYRKIIKVVKKYLNKNGALFLECGIGEAEEISKMLDGFSEVEIIKDLENVDRIIKAVV